MKFLNILFKSQKRETFLVISKPYKHGLSVSPLSCRSHFSEHNQRNKYFTVNKSHLCLLPHLWEKKYLNPGAWKILESSHFIPANPIKLARLLTIWTWVRMSCLYPPPFPQYSEPNRVHWVSIHICCQFLHGNPRFHFYNVATLPIHSESSTKKHFENRKKKHPTTHHFNTTLNCVWKVLFQSLFTCRHVFTTMES